jgi:hypothetical protein
MHVYHETKLITSCKRQNNDLFMKTFLKSILLFFIFSILFVVPNILIPLQIKMESQSEYNALMLFILLLTQFSMIIYLIKRLNLWGMKLFLCVVIIFWGFQTFMAQTETWYFRDAMPAITNEELRNLFLRPLITSVTFIPLAIWMLDRWKQDVNHFESHKPANLNWQQILSLSVAYVVIYFTFGYFVAWQFEEVRIFYSGGSEDAGFFAGLKNTLQTNSFLFPFQLLRGFLWIMTGLPIIYYLKGSKNEKIMACTILYSIPAIQLIVDNPFMPQQVRIAHLLEVGTSNGLFGLLIGYTSTRKNA